LEKLIEKCDRVLSTSDPKIEQLKNALNEQPNAKIVIFTEYKDTLDYIKRRLPEYNSVSIDGSVKFSERTRIMEDFWIPVEDGGPRILVGTDAAGEGIDLQISTVLINYDIPWNPNRLEQRMGRIHRIGQEHPVLFVNIVAADTQEGQVLSTLLKKLEVIGQTIGEEKVFDVISELVSEKSISQMMKNVLDGKSLEEIDTELNREIESSKLHIDKEELSIVNLDYELQFRQLDKRLTPEYTQSFLYKSLKYLQAEIRIKEDSFEITKLPDKFLHHPDFRELDLPLTINLRDKNVSNQINLLSKSFKLILDYIQSIAALGVENGTYLFDPYSKEPYVLWFFEIALTHNNEEIDRRVIARKSSGNEVHRYDPRGVINLRCGNKDDFKDLDVQKYQSLINENIENQIWEELLVFADEYKSNFIQPIEELWTARLSAAKEKQRYYSNLVVKNRRNESRRASAEVKYKMAKHELHQLESQKEMDLRMNLITPNLFSKIIVLPKIKNNQVDVDVEARSMEYALKYERDQGRIPIDVSLLGRGCDIESAPPNNTGNTRYIEVKGRSPGVQVMLEETELIKAERFGDRYWLYLYVFNEDGSVEFSNVQNPISKLPLKQIIRASVSISDIKKASKNR